MIYKGSDIIDISINYVEQDRFIILANKVNVP